MNADKITSKMVSDGDVCVEVYPMRTETDHYGDAVGCFVAENHDEAEFFDVWLRPDAWKDNDGMNYGEWEDLTLDEASKKVIELESQYPGIAVCWVNE